MLSSCSALMNIQLPFGIYLHYLACEYDVCVHRNFIR
jgi:hypothetical protein